MAKTASIMLFVADQPMLSSLEFSLALDGFEVIDGSADGVDPSAAVALVIDEDYHAGGLSMLAGLRAQRCAVPAIVLATHPTKALHAKAKSLQAMLVEKPLLDEELDRALYRILQETVAA